MRNVFTNVLLLQSENVQCNYVVTHLTSSYFNAEISTRLLDENRNFEYIYIYHLDTPCHTRFLPYCLIFLKVLHKYSANKYTIKYTTDIPRFSHRCSSFSFNRFTLHFPPNEVFYVDWQHEEVEVAIHYRTSFRSQSTCHQLGWETRHCLHVSHNNHLRQGHVC